MDVLSQVLDSVNMRGHLYFPTELRAAFGLRVPANTNVCRFHVAVEGGCYLSLEGERVWLGRGDLALVPHGREHHLQDDPATPLDDLGEALEASGQQGHALFRWGQDGDACRLVCGHFEFDRDATHPLLASLPAIVHVRATPTYDFRWIDQMMRFLSEETRGQRPGSGVITRRLSEVLFVQVIRHYAESRGDRAPVLAALTDPRLSRALYAMDTGLAEPWTLDSLARESGMSRTAFAVRFHELLGRTPMKYLADQRMRQAAKLLRAGHTLGTVADRVGYQSEAAFARRFKRFTGIGPGAYRQQQRNGRHDRTMLPDAG